MNQIAHKRYASFGVLFYPLATFCWWSEVLSAIKLSFIATYDNVLKNKTDNNFHSGWLTPIVENMF